MSMTADLGKLLGKLHVGNNDQCVVYPKSVSTLFRR
jgi:hypothetical protein